MIRNVNVILLLWFTSSEINGQNYDTRGTLIYEDLGCIPIKADTNDQLASSYNCDEPFNNPCLYQGKKYEINKAVPWQVSLPSCSSSCRCKSDGFSCAILRCPEVGLVTLGPGCYHTYSLKECCNRGEVCPPFDDVATCQVDGKVYMMGQKFFPNNTNLHCICDEDFEGKYETTFCRKVVCGLKLKNKEEINKRCAPFYSDKNWRLCPTSWICPSDEFTDEIKTSGKQSGEVCVYGDKKIQMKDYFERIQKNYIMRGDDTIRCACEVPPLLTCLQNSFTPWNK